MGSALGCTASTDATNGTAISAAGPTARVRATQCTSCDLTGSHLAPPSDLSGTDPDFGPSSSRSLAGSFPCPVTWARPGEFGIEGAATVCKGPSPDDIKQGALGDCYFLSALSVLAEQPERVTRLFESPTTDEEGNQWFHMKIKVGGRWQLVSVDDFFPVTAAGPDKKQLAFSRSSDETDLWVCVAEKAWAKLHGTYADIEAGDPAMVLSCLTGAPCDSIAVPASTSEEKWQEIWDKVIAAAKDNLMTACSTRDDASSNGLVPGHAYAVLDAKVVEGHKLFQIRNPWGKGEWKGDWSDDSALWTESAKAEVTFSTANDGIFWMEDHDFVKYFDYVTINFYQKSWHYAEEDADLHESGAGEPVVLQVSASGPVMLAVHQPEARLQGPRYKYNAIGFEVLKQVGDGTYEFVMASPIQRACQVWKKLDLEAGNYVVVPRSIEVKKKTTIVVEAYSPISIDVVDGETDDPWTIMFKAYYHSALNNASQVQTMDQAQQPNIKFSTAQLNPTTIFLHENGSTDVNLVETVTFDTINYTVHEIDPATWVATRKGGGGGKSKVAVKIKLEPGQKRMIVLTLAEKLKGNATRFSQNTSLSFEPVVDF